MSAPAIAQRDSSSIIDTAFVFGAEPAPQEKAKREKKLEMLISGGAGLYQTFREDEYKMLFQPVASLDFYLEPGGIGFILGGHFGYADFFTQGISFGIRERLGFLSIEGLDTYTELSVLFFDDKAYARSFETGFRGALAGVFPQNTYGLMLRMAVEYRGRRSPPGHDDPLKPLYWAGLEAGVNFSLLSRFDGLTRKDSIRAALRHILNSEELTQFDGLSNDGVDTWYERYWQKKDLTPNTLLNEAREEFESRVRYANSQFGRLKRLGVETDRGRAIVVYGRPNYIETGEAASSTTSYELWVYENRVRGYQGALFLFESGYTGEYRQIYSNVIGEITGALPAAVPNRIFKVIDRYDPQR